MISEGDVCGEMFVFDCVFGMTWLSCCIVVPSPKIKDEKGTSDSPSFAGNSGEMERGEGCSFPASDNHVIYLCCGVLWCSAWLCVLLDHVAVLCF